ncbi:MAG TPA: sigma-70 family RNA polymerase sigma factor [Terriglobales bacterium]|nr:sigma-70 family RNA polymerase sigma factor [Terriglobales bacterium]
MKALKSDAEERLLIEAAKRDPARFGELYRRNVYQVYAYVRRRVSSREQAEDITSDVFHHALKTLPDFEWRGLPFAAWLIRIAAHRVVDHWRSSAREVNHPAPEEREDPNDSPLEELERRATLFQLVRQLPEEQRRVVTLRFVEEKSIREIAQAIGRSEGAVKQLQFRALQKLRESVEGGNG